MTLVDTSAWIDALRTDGDQEVRRGVAELLTAGQAALCDMVVLELWNGAGGEEERAKLRRLFDTLRIYAVDGPVWEEAGALAQRCRAGGITVPATDLLIATTARVHGLSLLHSDEHFLLLDHLTDV